MTILDALHVLKDHAIDSLPDTLIRHSCQRVKYQWRERSLGPVRTTHLFLQQVLHGNTAVPHLRRLTRQSFTDSAYCQARARLPLAMLQDLQQCLTGKLRAGRSADPEATWRGHRVFFLDGSAFSMPDTPPLRAHFGKHGLQADGCGFPTARLLCLFHGHDGYLIRAIAAPLRSHDLTHAAVMHATLRPGDVVVGDRNFASYGHIASCQKHGIHGVFRAHQARIVCFRPHRRHRRPGRKSPQGSSQKDWPTSRWIGRLGVQDQLVEYFKPAPCPAWMSKEEWDRLPDTMIVRELRYRVRTPGRRSRVITLTTTLLDAARYPATAIARLFGLRWGVETDLRYLKSTMKMAVLRCENVDGVLKELTVFAIVYNLVRRVMQEAARRQQVPLDRISFIDALRWLQQAVVDEPVAMLVVNPDRPDRYEPRQVKRRKKKYPHLKQPRAKLKNLMKRQGLVT